MIFTSTDELIKHISANNLKSFRLFEGYVRRDTMAKKTPIWNYFTKDDEPEIGPTHLAQLLNNYPGKYTLMASHRLTQIGKSPVLIKFDNGHGVEIINDVHQEPGETLNGMTLEQMDSLIMSRANEIIEKREAARILQEKEDRLKELETSAGRFSFFAAKFSENLLQTPTVQNILSQLMGSNQLQGATTMNGPGPTDLENSLAILVEALGPETIIKLAAKFQSGQAGGIVPLVQNFANS